jgi:hypothetical protein
MTPLGNIESQVKQGDVNWLADAAAGTHSDTSTGHNHSGILTSKPTTYYRGIYATSDTASSTASTWTSSGEGALLFGGRKKSSTAWKVGDMAVYDTKYFIHTNASGSCNDHDIMILSRTKVTYMGISTKCSDTDQKKLFLYETIWNHTATNTIDNGVQVDDTDAKLGFIPHKGYFKWVRSTDSNDNDLFKGVEILMGDKEFGSVFNHSSDNRFQSAVINVNIDKVRMIGWSNPPTIYNSISNTMQASTTAFPTTAWLPTNSKDWDWPDMVGTRSAFSTATSTNGFDFSDFRTVLNTINSPYGYMQTYTKGSDQVLPDVSPIPGAAGNGTVYLYKTTTPATWPGSWTGPAYQVSMPGSPLLDTTYALPPTVITATISGPYFSGFEIRRGSANLLFDAANGIPFNIYSLQIETRGAGASITIGTTANPATVFAQTFKLQSEDCGGTINFNFTGKMVAKKLEFENNVKYTMDTTLGGGSCLSSATQSFIYLRKNSWTELRN